MQERKKYLDNIRWITLCIVILYHIIYIFNNSGVISNINVKGIPIMDCFLVFVYPWFMCLLFLISGISSRYSLEKRTTKEFMKDRKKRILIPSIVGIFAYGWISGLITNQYTDMFAGNGSMIPGLIKYFIYCLMGIGVLWYCHVLFINSALTVLLKKIDKNNKIDELCKKINLPILFGLVILVWLSSLILNTPLISVYRFGIYIFMYMLGYYIFYQDKIIEKLEKISIPLGILSFILGIVYTIYYYGSNYTDMSCLKSIFTNVYLYLMILSILGLGKKFLNFSNKFTEYMRKNNFNFYVLHYTIIVILGHLLVQYLNLPFILNYIIILIGTIIILPIVTEIIKKIPILNKLLLGIYKK